MLYTRKHFVMFNYFAFDNKSEQKCHCSLSCVPCLSEAERSNAQKITHEKVLTKEQIILAPLKYATRNLKLLL